MDEKRVVALQVRVDAGRAERFAALARAMNVTSSELLRQAIDELLVKTENHVGALSDRIQHQVSTERDGLRDGRN